MTTLIADTAHRAGGLPPPADGAVAPRPLTVAFIPSVSGGLGHVARTLKLARALERADPSLRPVYVLDEVGLKPVALEAVERTGYPVRVLPNPVCHERDERIAAAIGDIDVVVEDTARRLIAHRRVLPNLRAWISVPMLPLWDELHMDRPLLEHVDHILYAYPPIMPLPAELDDFRTAGKLTVTGPILDPEEIPTRIEARRRLELDPDLEYIVYAPRGFPFGRWFGLRILNGVVGAYLRLRRERPNLRLNLLAVPDPVAVQPRRVPPLDRIDGLALHGVVPPDVARDHVAAADLVVLEGTSTLFDAAVARTPVLMVPGPIYETWLEGTWVDEQDAGVVMRPGEVTHARMAAKMREALDPITMPGRVERLHDLVGQSGRDLAVAAIRRVIAKEIPR